MTRYLFLLVMIVFAARAAGQAPCATPESHQFDFWMGQWDAVYNDSMHALNSITKDLDSCVIHEHFYDPAKKYRGESWSVYNPKTKTWQQTWVDNSGGYIVLTGVFENGEMALSTQPRPYTDGKMIQSRMVYHNITAIGFDWRWEATTDGGKTWTPNWLIHYHRRN